MGSLLNEEEEGNQTKVATKAPSLPPESEITLPTPNTPPIAEVKQQAVKIPDWRGKRIAEKDKLYTSLGISRKLIPPLTRKRVAIYQLLYKGKRDKRMIDPMDQIVDPQPYQMVPNYTIIDTGESNLSLREKTMTYHEGGTETIYREDPITKRQIPMSIPKVGSPEFINGQVTVNIYNEFQKFVWWELHPRNASNKRRDFGKEPIFERVDTKFESSHVQMIKMDLALDAERYILKLKEDKLMNLAGAMTNPTVNPNINPQELRLVMRMRAKANPEEILYSAPDQSASVKVAVIHAIDLGILTYLPEYNAYYYNDEEEPLHTVLEGTNPFEDLTGYLSSSKGEEDLNRIKRDLDFWF